MKRLKTLRIRFALWTAGLLLVALVLFGFFVYINMSHTLAASLDDSLRLTATQLSAEADTQNGELISVDNFVDNARITQLQKNGFSMRVSGPGGQILQEYGPYRNLPQPEVDFIITNQSGLFTTVTNPDSGDTIRVYTTPVIEDNQVVGILQVAQNLNGVRQTLNQLLITILIAGPLIVLIAGSGGYFLAARALNPIDQITRTARQISAKDLSARLNLPSTDDEVGRLAATFDTMLARLDNGFRRERQFIADASHELRTPLTTMQTILSSTLARQRTLAEYEQALVDLAEETERMKLLAEGLLLLARNDADPSAAYKPVDLSTLLQDVTDSLYPLTEGKNLALECRIPPNLSIIGDRDGLIRLFVNLLGNAIKYTEQGRITITLNQETDEFIEVAIADTGIGIAPEHLPYIFDRFYQVEASRTTSGTGLGLAIALSVAQAHGATISVESEIGKGTVFLVKLAKLDPVVAQPTLT